MKEIVRGSFILLRKTAFALIIACVIYFVGKMSYRFFYEFILQTPIQNQSVKDVEINIPKGSRTEDIAQILKDKGLIKSKYTFLIRVKVLSSESDQNLRYGKYTLNTSLTEQEIINKLAMEGEQKETLRITIPEGYSVVQIANKLQEEDICKAEDFTDVIDSINFDYKIFDEIPKDNRMRLQGYLFPDTYEIYKDASAKDVISTMLANFDKKFIKEYYDRAEELGLSVHEVITLAALIEKEAKLPEERPIIAGVIYNRLKKDHPLEIDASIQYILSNGDFQPRRIFNSDLEIESEYNTYKVKGLAYGPICNPGIESIKAALYPEKHNYFYYILVDEATGKHQFTTTWEQHNELKRKYR